MKIRVLCALVCPILLLTAFDASAQRITLEPPGERDFVLDLARMIDPEDAAQIKQVCDATLTEKAIPIIVVTIENMAKYGGGGMRIETFATLLFNQWEIGHEEINKQYWNKGILLIVSEGDRYSRIELGDGWGREQDGLARQIMDEQIVSRFKQGNFSAGILNGVLALEKMARGEELPRKPFNPMRALLIAGCIGLVIFTVVSLIRTGASGWAWLFWGVVFSILGFILISMMRNAGRGGGFGGGSFGGGFSGGGGASGSW